MDQRTDKKRPDFITPATAAWVGRTGAIHSASESSSSRSRTRAATRATSPGPGSTPTAGYPGDGDRIAATEEEKKAIEAEVAEAIETGKFPKSIAASRAEAKHQIDVIRGRAKHKSECFSFLDRRASHALHRGAPVTGGGQEDRPALVVLERRPVATDRARRTACRCTTSTGSRTPSGSSSTRGPRRRATFRHWSKQAEKSLPLIPGPRICGTPPTSAGREEPIALGMSSGRRSRTS